MNKNIKKYVMVLVIPIFIITLSFILRSYNSKLVNNDDSLNNTVENEVDTIEYSGKYEIKDFKVSWNSMYPLLQNGEKIIVLDGYYEDNEWLKDDIIVYNYAWEKNPVVKSIKVTSDDKVEVKWLNLYVNDEILTNLSWKIYKFSKAEIKVLSMYIKNNKIPNNSYFIFWENVSNSIDSRKFWAVWSADFIGKLKE